MFSKVKIVATLTTLMMLVSSFSTSSAEDIPDEQFSAFYGANSNQVAAYWTESAEAIAPSSVLIGTDPTVESDIKTDMCDSLFDEKCAKFSRFFWASYSEFCDDSKIQSNLNPVTLVSFNCIEQLIAQDSSGKKTIIDASTPELIRKVNPELEGNYKGADLLIPRGSERAIIRIPGVIHKGGTDTYLVDMYMSGDFTRSNIDNGKCSTNASVKFCINNGADNKFFASIKPVISSKTNLLGFTKDSLFDRKISFRGIGGSSLQCLIFEEGICWKPVGFPDGFSFGLKMKLSIGTLNGWMHGRALMDDFESNFSEIERGKGKFPTQTITLIGKPSKVAVAGGLKDDAELRDMMQALGISTIRTFFYNSFWANFSLDRFIGFSKLIGDTALASPQIWSVRNIRSKDFYNLDKNTIECIQNEPGVSGYVSTNATAYSSGPPSFNSKEGTLDYRVASTHFNKDGSLNRGNYSLVLKSRVAKCVYGFSSSPALATISVISESGTNVVSTSSLKTDSEWIKLKTDNFTFSAPTLRVKLETEPPKSTTSKSVDKPSVVSKKTTISCIKGKTTKKVTAINPKCPAGYKKK
jgi:hypothetical protein